jgi:hypothetical protein
MKVVEVQQLAPDQGASGAAVDLGAAGKLRLTRHVSLAGDHQGGGGVGGGSTHTQLGQACCSPCVLCAVRCCAGATTTPELRRHKRGFLKLATKLAFSRLQDPVAAQRLFVDHLRLQLVPQQ